MSYTADELNDMPTLAVGQTDDLKVDTGEERVWLARTGVDDGEPYNNRVSHETLVDGRWEDDGSYQG